MAFEYIGFCDRRFKPLFETLSVQYTGQLLGKSSLTKEDWDDPLYFDHLQQEVDKLIADAFIEAIDEQTQQWHDDLITLLKELDVNVESISDIRVCSRLLSLLIEYEV